MRQWVITQLRSDGHPPWVVIDPAGIATNEEITAAFPTGTAMHRAREWAETRRVWERHGRVRSGKRSQIVIVVTDPTVHSSADIAWDIDSTATIVTVRIPGERSVRDALLSLDPTSSDVAVARIQSSSWVDHASVLTAAAGLAAMELSQSPASQFRTALRLHMRGASPQTMELARSTITDSLASAMLTDPIGIEAVQNAWDDWANNPSKSRWTAHFEECGSEVAGLLLNGTLKPVDAPTGTLPGWARIGICSQSPSDRVATLLGSVPADPSSFEEWTQVAEWWGEVRSNLALINPPDETQVTAAWREWDRLDITFRTWLTDSYGAQLTRAWAGGPVSLDKVQPFLASRMRDGGRILLIVLDGMGFAQWSLIRSHARLRVIRGSGVLAMIPTLTEVSRQAIASGKLPTGFARSLATTRKEPDLWGASWAGAADTPSWTRLDGASVSELDHLPLGSSDAIGVVLSATDELMHSSALLGDVGLHASLQAWIRTGVLDTLIARAAEHRYETWITSDHGNLNCESTPSPREGAFVERAGKRVRRYATRSLRNDGAAAGHRWDTIPGYPRSEAERLLFATGRSAWGESSVSHGGLSLDEVIVPFVQVEPK